MRKWTNAETGHMFTSTLNGHECHGKFTLLMISLNIYFPLLESLQELIFKKYMFHYFGFSLKQTGSE